MQGLPFVYGEGRLESFALMLWNRIFHARIVLSSPYSGRKERWYHLVYADDLQISNRTPVAVLPCISLYGDSAYHCSSKRVGRVRKDVVLVFDFHRDGFDSLRTLDRILFHASQWVLVLELRI